MGVKRNQDSGKRDALGRMIKVSGQTSERASESSVDGGKSGVRSDFAGSADSSDSPYPYRQDLATLVTADIETWHQGMSDVQDDLNIRGTGATRDPMFAARKAVLIARQEDFGRMYESVRQSVEVSKALRGLQDDMNEIDSSPFHRFGSKECSLVISVPADASREDIEQASEETEEIVAAEYGGWKILHDTVPGAGSGSKGVDAYVDWVYDAGGEMAFSLATDSGDPAIALITTGDGQYSVREHLQDRYWHHDRPEKHSMSQTLESLQDWAPYGEMYDEDEDEE